MYNNIVHYLGWLICLIFLFTGNAAAESPLVLKRADINAGTASEISTLPKGRLLQGDGNTIYLYTGEEIKTLTLSGTNVSETAAAVFRGDALADAGRVSPDGKTELSQIKRHWRFNFPAYEATCFAGSEDGDLLYAGDEKGNVYFFDVRGRFLIGSLIFLRQPVKLIKPLRDGSLVLFYRGESIAFIKRTKPALPFLAFMQELKNRYALSSKTELPLGYVDLVTVNENGTRMAVSGNHNQLTVFDLPSLNKVFSVREKGFINFIRFSGDGTLLYAVSREFSLFERPLGFTNYSNMSSFFDWRRTLIVSPSGREMLRISDRDSFVVYDLRSMKLKGEIAEDIRSSTDVRFGEDGETIFFLDENRKKFSIYRTGN